MPSDKKKLDDPVSIDDALEELFADAPTQRDQQIQTFLSASGGIKKPTLPNDLLRFSFKFFDGDFLLPGTPEAATFIQLIAHKGRSGLPGIRRGVKQG